jgi:protein-tyrosine-phosphatase
MAEALLRDALREQQDIIVESAGLGALVDHPASEHAVTLMRERGSRPTWSMQLTWCW